MAKQTATSAGQASRVTTITEGERHRMIATAAYYRAGRRGFQDGDADADWLQAEAEIDRMIGQSPGNRGEASGSARRAFLDKLESELRGFDARLDELAEKARDAKKRARTEYCKQLNLLSEKRVLADQRLSELKDRSGDALNDVKEGAEKLWNEIRTTIDKMASRFK